MASAPGPDETTPAETAAPAPPAPSEFGEFDALLADLGAEPPPAPALPARPPDAGPDLKDVTISELTSMLAALRPVGDLLAQSELHRIELERLLTERSTEVATNASEISNLRREIGRLKGHVTQARRTTERAAARYAECKHIALGRWREVRALQAEKKKLLAELERLRKRKD